MNKLIEEAFNKSWYDDFYEGNYKDHASIGFKAGIEWFKSLFPMMKFPPCNMPEKNMVITEDLIISTTEDYIIFYKKGGHDIAYREYFKDKEPKWKWKVNYGRYVEDDEILCWIKNDF